MNKNLNKELINHLFSNHSYVFLNTGDNNIYTPKLKNMIIGVGFNSYDPATGFKVENYSSLEESSYYCTVSSNLQQSGFGTAVLSKIKDEKINYYSRLHNYKYRYESSFNIGHFICKILNSDLSKNKRSKHTFSANAFNPSRGLKSSDVINFDFESRYYYISYNCLKKILNFYEKEVVSEVESIEEFKEIILNIEFLFEVGNDSDDIKVKGVLYEQYIRDDFDLIIMDNSEIDLEPIDMNEDYPF